jgi:polyisoprenoid-binding protein YceI
MKYWPCRILLLVVAFMIGGSFQTALGAEVLALDRDHSYMLFKVTHLGVASSYGRFNDISGTIHFDEADPVNCKFAFNVVAASVDTGNDKRNAHLRSADFFHVAEYPTITFVSRRVKRLAPNRFEVVGDITLLATTHRVTTEVVQTGAGLDSWGNYRRGFETDFSIKRSEYGMSHLLQVVSDTVTLTLSVEGMRQP